VLTQEVGEVIRYGLHEYLDELQAELNRVSRALGRDFFGDAPAQAAE
jgi:uncharacterized alpha-E superfamily protein